MNALLYYAKGALQTGLPAFQSNAALVATEIERYLEANASAKSPRDIVTLAERLLKVIDEPIRDFTAPPALRSDEEQAVQEYLRELDPNTVDLEDLCTDVVRRLHEVPQTAPGSFPACFRDSAQKLLSVVQSVGGSADELFSAAQALMYYSMSDDYIDDELGLLGLLDDFHVFSKALSTIRPQTIEESLRTVRLSPRALREVLYVREVSEEEPHPLPNWADFLSELGNQVGQLEIDAARWIVSLTVPTVDFAALFIAAGLLRAKSLQRSTTQLLPHFERLCSLPAGTALNVFHNKKWIPGVIDVVTSEPDGITRIVVTINRKKKTRLFFDESRSSLLEIREGGGSRKAPSRIVTIRKDRRGAVSQFLTELVSPIQGGSYQRSNGPWATIMGSSKRVRREAQQAGFCALFEDSFVDGDLNELLRLKGTLSDAYDPKVRTISSRFRNLHSGDSSEFGRFIILEDPKAFEKVYSRFPQCHIINILDVSNPSIGSNIIALEEALSRRKSEVQLRLPLPPGLELYSFQE